MIRLISLLVCMFTVSFSAMASDLKVEMSEEKLTAVTISAKNIKGVELTLTGSWDYQCSTVEFMPSIYQITGRGEGINDHYMADSTFGVSDDCNFEVKVPAQKFTSKPHFIRANPNGEIYLVIFYGESETLRVKEVL